MTNYKDRVSGWPTDIDWSKAPEGATHHFNGSGEWYRQDEGVWKVWYKHEGGWHESTCAFRVSDFIPRPAPQWNGEGLPPVGASVVLDDSEHGVFDDYRAMIGVPVVVTAAFKSPTGVDMIACALPGGLCGCFRAEMARPTKTPAQIAAEEREAAIEAMWKIYWQPDAPTAKEALGLLWDAGLRFPKGDDQ